MSNTCAGDPNENFAWKMPLGSTLPLKGTETFRRVSAKYARASLRVLNGLNVSGVANAAIGIGLWLSLAATETREARARVKKHNIGVCVEDSKTKTMSSSRTLDLPEDCVDDDVFNALSLLWRDFPLAAFPTQSVRVALRTQAYSVVVNRTLVDMRVAQLVRVRRVRTVLLFKGASTDDVAILEASEFARALSALVDAHCEVKRAGPTPTERDRRFGDMSDERTKRARVESRTEAVLRRFAADVCQLTPGEPRLALGALRAALRQCGDEGDCETCVQWLVECGALVAADATNFFWAIPNGGAFLKALLAGRKEAMAIVKRSKFRELPRKQLEQKPLRSPLGWNFHLRDLLGADALVAVPISGDSLLKTL